ncbi:MAG: HEAT repeat domain-containing protein [Anaerolineales bacterium]|jgi:hypothetical protein
MAGKKANFRIASRDLIAAALLGPGPALDAAAQQLARFDAENGQSSISGADLRHLASEVMKAANPSIRLELLHLLAQLSSPTAHSICAYGLPRVWEQAGHMALAENISRDRSSEVQSHLTQALMDLEPEQQRRLSEAWFESPNSSQRAIAARLIVAYPASRALQMLTTLSSDEQARVREAAVEALIDIAGSFPDDVTESLQAMLETLDKHKLWVITRVVSRAPLNHRLSYVINLLESLRDDIPEDRDIHRWVVSVLRALARQHGNQPVQEALDHWLKGEDTILAEVAAEALRRIA